MCPICLSTLAWLAIGGGSTASAIALLAGWRLEGKNHGDDYDSSNGDA
jgi:hypothetical protein